MGTGNNKHDKQSDVGIHLTDDQSISIVFKSYVNIFFV
jgi:hypothetical protein